MLDNEPEIMTEEMEHLYRKDSKKAESANRKKFGKKETIVTNEISEKRPRKEKKKKTSKKELSSYFEKSKKKNTGLWIKESKRSKKKENEVSQVSKVDYEDVQNIHVYQFRGKKFFKVDVFIKYLEDNYLDIDKIAKEVLDDENFYGWISHNSELFGESIRKFKELKEKIENN